MIEIEGDLEYQEEHVRKHLSTISVANEGERATYLHAKGLSSE